MYCISCNKFVASIGGHVRKGAVMVCSKCIERYKSADETMDKTLRQAKCDPDFEKLLGIFGRKK